MNHPDASLIRSALYHADLKQRGPEQDKIAQMENAGVAEPVATKLVLRIVFEPKKNGDLRVCVDCRLVTAVRIRDSFFIQRMDECIVSLGEARILSTLCANYRYWQNETGE